MDLKIKVHKKRNDVENSMNTNMYGPTTLLSVLTLVTFSVTELLWLIDIDGGCSILFGIFFFPVFKEINGVVSEKCSSVVVIVGAFALNDHLTSAMSSFRVLALPVKKSARCKEIESNDVHHVLGLIIIEI